MSDCKLQMEIYEIKSCDDDAGKLITYSEKEYVEFQQNAHAIHNFYTYGFKEMQIDKDNNRNMFLKLPIDSYILPIKQDVKSLVVINKIKPISTFPILTNQEYDNYGTIYTIQQKMNNKTIDIKFIAGLKNIVKHSITIDDQSNTEIYHYICEIGKLFQNKFI